MESPFNFNVTVKNVGNISDWMQNTLTEQDASNLVKEAKTEPTKFGVEEKAKEALLADGDVMNIAASIVDANTNKDHKIDSKTRNTKIDDIKQQFVKQITANDNFATLMKLYKGDRPNPLMLEHLGIKEMHLDGKVIDVSKFEVSQQTKMISALVKQFLSKKYNEIQTITASKLADIGGVYFFNEFGTQFPESNKHHDRMLIRPETQEIAKRGDYELHCCNDIATPDAVIAVPKKLFKNIVNQSFMSEVDIACVTATHKKSNKACMFISTHVPGFEKAKYQSWKEKLPEREKAFEDAKKEYKEKYNEDFDLRKNHKGVYDRFSLNTQKQELEKKKSNLSDPEKAKIDSQIKVIDACLNLVDVKAGLEAVANGDKVLREIGEAVRLFREQCPGGVVVFGGDLNTHKELYEGRHKILEEAGLTVRGSGKPTNIQYGDAKTATELDFIAANTTNPLSGKKIAKFEIKESVTADKFNAGEEASDHLHVSGQIKLKPASKARKVFYGFLSVMSSLTKMLPSNKSKETTEAPNSLLQHKVTFKDDVHDAVPQPISQTEFTASTDVKGPATTTASSIPLTHTTTGSIPKPADETKEKEVKTDMSNRDTDDLLKRLGELNPLAEAKEVDKPNTQQASRTQPMKPPKPPAETKPKIPPQATTSVGATTELKKATATNLTEKERVAKLIQGSKKALGQIHNILVPIKGQSDTQGIEQHKKALELHMKLITSWSNLLQETEFKENCSPEDLKFFLVEGRKILQLHAENEDHYEIDDLINALKKLTALC